MTPTVYVINMDRATDRWSRVSGRLAAQGLSVVRVAALDASTDRDAVLRLRGLKVGADGKTLRPSIADGRPYTAPEEGCFQSHLKALRSFLDSNTEHGVIAEDDILPQQDFAQVVAALAARPGLEIVKLEAAIWQGARPVMPLGPVAGRRLAASFRASSGSACYLVSRKGAAKLLAAAPRHFAAYDEYLCDVSAHGASILDVVPMIAEQEKHDTNVHDPALERQRPVKFGQRGWFAGRRFWRRSRRALMALSAGRWRVWRLTSAPWWTP